MLPANISSLKTALQRTQEFVSAAAQQHTYLKMDKGGNWTNGSEDDVSEDSEWALNPASFYTGYNAFDQDGKKQGEETSLLSEPPVIQAELPSVGAAWKPLMGVEVKCLAGDDVGLEAVVAQSSINGLKSLGKVLGEIMKRIEKEDTNCVPVVKLSSSKYRHKTYGMIYSADFEIVRWASVNGEDAKVKAKAIEEPEEVEAEEVAEEATPKPTRRRKRATA